MNIKQIILIYKLSIIFTLLFILPITAMTEEMVKQQNVILEHGDDSDDEMEYSIANEEHPVFGKKIRLKILKKIYFDQSFILNSKNIFEAFAKLKTLKNIFFTCKQLYNLRDRFDDFNNRALENYKILLKEHFLEERKGQIGLYPKNTTWGTKDFDEYIAKFMQNPTNDNPILFNLLSFHQQNETRASLELMHLLLFYGASPDQPGNKTLNTPIIIATQQNEPQAVDLLLKYGAQINKQNGFNNTALTIAVLYNLKLMVKLLLANGANIYLDSYFGTAIDIAKKHNYAEILQLLKKEKTVLRSCTLI